MVVVAPGGGRAYDAAEWRDALVLVERGRIELWGPAGGRLSFGPGEVLWLAGLTLDRLHNPGWEPAVLVAVSR